MREIQYLAEGDTVYTYNISSCQIEEAIIPNIFARNSQEFIKLYVAGDTIVCTPEHPFFVNNDWVAAKELKRGDSLFTFSGYKVAIDSIFTFRTDTATAVYNLEASGNHNYYVSASQVLVHNCNTGFKSISAFKRVYGSAGKGHAWHHIVEQGGNNVSRFGAEAIHNVNNIIKLPHGAGSIHAKVTGYYNSLIPGTSIRVRDYVRTLNFEQQYQYGIDVLKRFGWKP